MASSFQRLVVRQGGVFTRDQAPETYSPTDVRRFLRRREWRRTSTTGS